MLQALPIADRYRNAARAFPANSVTPQNAIDGYWVSAARYFFGTLVADPGGAAPVDRPFLADAAGAVVTALWPLADNVGLGDAEGFDMPTPDTLVATRQGVAHLIDLASGAVTGTEPLASGPELYSPGGRWACRLDGENLALRDRRTGETHALTTDGERLNPYGQMPESGTDTISYRRRPTPVGVWSPDGEWLLTHRIDERDLPDQHFVENLPADGGRPRLHSHKLVTPKDPLPPVQLVAIHVASGRMVRAPSFPLHFFSPIATGAAWFVDEAQICYLVFDRYKTWVELRSLDLKTGDDRLVLTERAAQGYLELHPLVGAPPNVRLLPQTQELIWCSERDGWAHLYLYDAATGALKNQITSGAWMVRDIVHVDAARRSLLFTAGGDDPERDTGLRRLCRVGLDGAGFEVLVEHDGDVGVPAEPLGPNSQHHPFRPATVRAGASETGRHVVVRRSSLRGGSQTVLLSLDGGAAIPLAQAEPDWTGAFPQRFTTLAADGETRLHGVLFAPTDFDPQRRYPLIDAIYPGPQSTSTPRAYRGRNAAQAQAIAELGCIVMAMDTRGIPLRERRLRQAGYGHQYEPQLSDQVAAIRQLCERFAFIDGERVGVMGTSAGGLAAARAMFDYPEVFKAGVSITGGHDTRIYLSGWMDQFGGPDADAAWGEQASKAAAGALQGALMIVTADMDENVHISQSLGLVDALIKANKDFELLVIPNHGHMLQMSSGYAQRRIWDFLVRNLLGEVPPPQFELTIDPARARTLAIANAREGAW